MKEAPPPIQYNAPTPRLEQKRADSAERKKELFQYLEERFNALPRKDVLDIVEYIFELSVDDGLLVARQAQVTPDELIDVIGNPRFYLKHPQVAHHIQERITNQHDLANKTHLRLDPVSKKAIEELLPVYQKMTAIGHSSSLSDIVSPEYRSYLNLRQATDPASQWRQQLRSKIHKTYEEAIEERLFVKDSDRPHKSGISPGVRMAHFVVVRMLRAAESSKEPDKIPSQVHAAYAQVTKSQLLKEVNSELENAGVHARYDAIDRKTKVEHQHELKPVNERVLMDTSEFREIHGAFKTPDDTLVVVAHKEDGLYVAVDGDSHGPFALGVSLFDRSIRVTKENNCTQTTLYSSDELKHIICQVPGNADHITFPMQTQVTDVFFDNASKSFHGLAYYNSARQIFYNGTVCAELDSNRTTVRHLGGVRYVVQDFEKRTHSIFNAQTREYESTSLEINAPQGFNGFLYTSTEKSDALSSKGLTATERKELKLWRHGTMVRGVTELGPFSKVTFLPNKKNPDFVHLRTSNLDRTNSLYTVDAKGNTRKTLSAQSLSSTPMRLGNKQYIMAQEDYSTEQKVFELQPDGDLVETKDIEVGEYKIRFHKDAYFIQTADTTHGPFCNVCEAPRHDPNDPVALICTQGKRVHASPQPRGGKMAITPRGSLGPFHAITDVHYTPNEEPVAFVTNAANGKEVHTLDTSHGPYESTSDFIKTPTGYAFKTTSWHEDSNQIPQTTHYLVTQNKEYGPLDSLSLTGSTFWVDSNEGNIQEDDLPFVRKGPSWGDTQVGDVSLRISSPLADPDGRRFVLFNGDQLNRENTPRYYCDNVYKVEEISPGYVRVLAQKGNTIVEDEFPIGPAAISAQIEFKIGLVDLISNPGTFDIEHARKVVEMLSTTDTHITARAGFMANLPPDEILRFNPAEPSARPAEMAERILDKIFPTDIFYKKSWREYVKGLWKSLSSLADRVKGAGSNEQENNPFSFQRETSSSLLGGNPASLETGNRGQEIIKLTPACEDFLATTILGTYDKIGRTWETELFAVDRAYPYEYQEVVAELPRVLGGTKTVLPMPIDGRIKPDSVEVLAGDGLWKPISQVHEDALGIVEIDCPPTAKKVRYSFEHPTNRTLPDIDDGGYQAFREKFQESHGPIGNKESYLAGTLGTLPSFMNDFVETIRDLPVREKVIAIEKYVRTILYYDENNGEVEDLKNLAAFEERLDVMQKRMAFLSAGKLEEVGIEEKKLAGVCTDAAFITTALLREAGVLSGTLGGYAPSGSMVGEGDGHAASFVVLPNPRLGNELFIVDGTPHGLGNRQRSLLQELGISTPSLEEKDTEAQHRHETIAKEREATCEELIQVIEDEPETVITEEMIHAFKASLDDYLRGQLTTQDALTIKRIFDTYRFSPLHHQDLGNPQAQASTLRFVSGELDKTENASLDYIDPIIQTYPGTFLSELVEHILDKEPSPEQRKETISELQKLKDIMARRLNERESKSLEMIFKYHLLKEKRVV